MKVKFTEAIRYAVDMKALDEAVFRFFIDNFGCARKVYNLYVDHLYKNLEKAGYTGGARLPSIKLPEVTELKKEYPYLKKVDSLGLANAKMDFEDAVKRFNEQSDHKIYTKRALRRDRSGTEALSFRGLSGMPKFHAKSRGCFSYTTNCQYPGEGKDLKQPTVRLSGSKLHLPKIRGDIQLIVHRKIPEDAVIKNVTVSMDVKGRIYASIGYTREIEVDLRIREAALSGDAEKIRDLLFLGLDYSQPDFYVDSKGRKANYPHCYRRAEEKLARLQRQLSRMEQGSQNYGRKLKQIRKLHTRIANQRKDFLHKLSRELVDDHDVIVVEDINLRAMGECLNLGKNLHDNGFGMFRDFLSYKLERKGSVLVKVDRWYASTKTCHVCGRKEQDIDLGTREWTCPVCGTRHQRDENAAKNIEAEGRRIFSAFYAEWLEKDRKAREKAEKLSAGRRKKKKRKKKSAA
jgi:putative transposase